MLSRTEMDKKILKRFVYLESVLESDQNRILFETSRNLLLEVLNQITFDKYPDIGVNDAGQTIAEWHNYEDYAIISIIPLSEDRILFEGMKKNNALLTVSTTLGNLKKNHNSELFLRLVERTDGVSDGISA
jgi:hypothetical protein